MQSRGDGVHPWWVRGWPVQPSVAQCRPVQPGAVQPSALQPSAVQPTIVQSSALPVQSLTSQWVELQCRVQQLSEGEWVRRSSHQRRRRYCLHALPRPFPLDFKTASILIFRLVLENITWKNWRTKFVHRFDYTKLKGVCRTFESKHKICNLI